MFSKMITAGLLSVSAAIGKSGYPEPLPILDPSQYTEWSTAYGGSRRGYIDVPFQAADGSEDSVHMYRVDLVGDIKERGFAQGYLLAKEIVYFGDVAMSKYYIDAIMGIDLSKYPEPLQSILKIVQIKGAKAAPAAVASALQWVYDHEEQYMPSYLIDEMEAIGQGMCDFFGENCDINEMTNKVKQLNMFPELIRMACTAYGAWGPATASGKLLQIRALDLGGGPFANYTVLSVSRTTDQSEQAFASLSFPGMVGVITGVSEKGIGISEKVMYISGEPDPPGSYDGEPDVFVLRDILQSSANKEAAVEYMQAAKRTWGIWVGVGDYSSQEMNIVGYTQESAIAYTDKTMPNMTSQPYLENIVYVDKHAQPSGDASLYTPLTDFYGDISFETSTVILNNHQTGDLHIAMYDFSGDGGEMIISLGRINAAGEYGPEGGDTDSWKACNRPYLKFDLKDLWAGK